MPLSSNSSNSAHCAPSMADQRTCAELAVGESNESARELSGARSYYSLTRSYPAPHASRHGSTSEQQSTLTHRRLGNQPRDGLSRPPRQLAPQALLEAAEPPRVPAPVPVRATATAVMPLVLPPNKEGAPLVVSPTRSSFHSVSGSQPTLVFVPPAAMEEKARPVLCLPPRCVRVRPAAELATSPFYVSGVGIGQLPRYGQTPPPTRRAPGRSAPTSASSTPAKAAEADQSATLWDEAVSEADVIAFFGPTDAVTDSMQSSLRRSGRRPSVGKDASWQVVDAAQSSVCDLSLSDDIFTAGATVKNGSPASAVLRSQVIDLQAALQFQRNGARRQRESITTSHESAETL